MHSALDNAVLTAIQHSVVSEHASASGVAFHPGSVTDFLKETRRATVLLDGDTDPIDVSVLIDHTFIGARVMVIFLPPQGAFVIGSITSYTPAPTPVPLTGGWTSYSTYQNPVYWKDPFGMVHVKGVATGGARGVVAGTLPPGFRPGLIHRCSDSADLQHGLQTDIEPDGDIFPWIGAGTAVTNYFAIDTSFLAVN